MAGFLSPSAVANNQQVIAATSGHRIRVMGWDVSCNDATAAASYAYKSASGGAQLTSALFVSGHDVWGTDKHPITESGYFETNTSQGLFVDVGGFICYFTVYYILYTP